LSVAAPAVKPPREPTLSSQKHRDGRKYPRFQMSRHIRLEDLLSHADWLRRLAAHLVRGGGGADDLLQDTWEAALRCPPDPARPAQPWLAEVLRNLVRARGRKARRRRSFETQARVDPLGVPSAEVLLERAEAQRFVAELVIGLDEPYRSTVLLRYYEGLSGARIAAALDVPPGTVRWRLKEGLDRVRAGLDARYGGDHRGWTVMLAVPPIRAPAGPMEGALLMAAKTKLAVVGGLLAILALVGVAVVWRAPDRTAKNDSVHARRSLAVAGRPRAVLDAWARAGESRPGGIAGIVRDPRGRGVPGARIALVVSAAYEEMEDRTTLRPRATALSGGGGGFRFAAVPPGIYLLTATAQGWAPAERTDVALLPGESLTSIELRLAPGGVKISGSVSDAGGGPVGGAAIRALALGAARRPEGARTFLAATDGSGRYEIELARGSYRLVADADGYVPAGVDLLLDADQRRDFRLTPAARIAGRVIERGGGAVGGATVRLESDAIMAPESRTVIADLQGAFVFSNLSPGSFRISARAGALMGRVAHRVTVALGGATEIAIELTRGLAIAGRVVDAIGPVPGTRVRLNSDLATSTAGADGRYHLEGLPPGRHVITADAAGHAPAQVIVALEAADRDGVDLTLGAESALTGRVLGRDGGPVAGASVTAFVVRADALAESVISSAVARSDAAGRFHLAGLGPGDVRVEAEHPEGGRGVAGPFALEAASTREIEVRLGKGGMIRGTVFWDDRSAAAGVVASGNQSGRPGSSTMTDERGRYEIGPFPAGEVTVHVRPEVDPLGAGGEVKRLSLAAGEDREGVDLIIPRHDREISGIVLAPDGTPLTGATVGAAADYKGVSWRPYNKYARNEGGNYTVLSEADGTFAVKHLPAGTFTVWATDPGLPEADAFRVPAGTGGVRIRFTNAGTLAGQVVDHAGAAVTTYTLYALLAHSNDATPELKAARGYVQQTENVQDAAGAFEVTDLHPALYDLLITTPDGRGGRLGGIALGPGETRRDLRVTAGEVVRLKGRVVDADGERPVADVTVVGWLAMLKEQVSGRSDATGAFVLDGVVPGTIDLSLRGASGTRQVANRSITVPAGEREFDAGKFTLGTARPPP
jgi:RNA polymerase sigma factor (sigma-70 family)